MVAFLKKPFYKKPSVYVFLAFISLLVLIILPSKEGSNHLQQRLPLGEELNSAETINNSMDNNLASEQLNANSTNNVASENTVDSKQQPASSSFKRAINASIVKINPVNYQITEDVIGFVYSENINSVSSEVAGQITKLNVDIGSAVNKGDVIAVIANKELANNRTSILADIHKLKAQIDLQKTTLSRYKTLFSDGFISQSEVDNVQLQLTTLNQQLISLQSSLKNNDVQYEKLQVKSAISGIVQEKPLNVGDFVGVGVSIVKIVDTKKLRVSSNVSDEIIKYLKFGDIVQVSVINGKNTNNFTNGKLLSVSPSLDESTRTAQLIVSILNNDINLKPSSVVNLRLNIQTINNATLIPSQAVVLRPAGNVVYVLSNLRSDLGDNLYEVRQRLVQVKELNNGLMLETGNNLSKGEIIILEGASFLTDKAIVKLNEQQ